MKKFLYALFGLVLAVGLVGPADAGMNKRERANSNAEWVHGPTGNTYQIGRQTLIFRLDDVSANATDYQSVPQPGIITEIYCVLDNAITSANAIVAVGNFTAQVHAGTVTMTQSGSAEGSAFSTTGMSTSVTGGSVVEVGSDGGSSTTAITYCTVYVDPAAQ